MRGVRSYRPSAALVVALLALFFSVGGAGYANQVIHLIDGHQIKKGTIDANRLTERARAALKGVMGPRGQQGPPGPSTGPAGGDLSSAHGARSRRAGPVGTFGSWDGTLADEA